MKCLSKKLVSLAIACALAVSLAGAAQAATRTAFGTGNSGGVFYILGAGMADLINKNSKELELTAQSTSGTTENLNLVNANEIGFGFTVYDTAYFAYTGGREYEGKRKLENLRLVMMGHVGHHQTVVFADSPYKSMADLKGETIPTSPGVAAFLLDQASWKPWGIDVVKGKSPILSYSEQTTAMKDGTIKVANYNMAYPASTIMDLATTKPIRILSQTEETMAAILKEHPYWLRSVVPANTYSGQTEDAVNIGFPYAIVCSKDMPDAAVRDFLRVCFANDLSAIHPDGRYYSKDNKNYTAKPLVPYHPAAEAFLKEQGLF
ncbi:putative TRAP transporter solute receptor, TAXI family [uncultured delta proteobacterium]|uniref:Putative TRAP transporter solute receptor, TAXI family n=1 Tax=uncultured delta proteobacterium TaxID=34034 RepID=A0A212JJ79_9DELT|nr:putative TRAP transporter solute receptor, TAXI family [uncultured delta proteobacterium]